ncbi:MULTISPECIES: phosphoglycolate phosphatase [Nitrincola]|uniref:Phosphoglycolate phosphatase n=1 Tax=Nitrincola nitratireducens TaxID=1229521 RepID=W9V9F2_9GAMM|nr:MULTISPECIES: phosphoglycolate phosphatase [Nitrincola]EXJ12702.1 Phosphoglycolate phosphatase [Nitrincola nitratireducens]
MRQEQYRLSDHFESGLPRLVMFDLDGTLVDSLPDLAHAIDQMLPALGRPPAGIEQVGRWVGKGAHHLVQEALGLSSASQDPELFSVAYELFLAAYSQANGRQARLFPDVQAFIEYLEQQGVMLALVTNKPEAFTLPLLDAMNLKSHFSLIVSGDTLPLKKPHPDQLLHVIQHFGVDLAQSLMVGDSSNDVLAARAAGCPVVCVSYGYNHGESIYDAHADAVVDSMMALV